MTEPIHTHLPPLPPLLLCESLTAYLLPEPAYTTNRQYTARHYDVDRRGELVGRITGRLGDQRLGDTPWFVHVEEGSYLLFLNDTARKVRYFRTPEDALAALNEALNAWVADALKKGTN